MPDRGPIGIVLTFARLAADATTLLAVAAGYAGLVPDGTVPLVLERSGLRYLHRGRLRAARSSPDRGNCLLAGSFILFVCRAGRWRVVETVAGYRGSGRGGWRGGAFLLRVFSVFPNRLDMGCPRRCVWSCSSP